MKLVGYIDQLYALSKEIEMENGDATPQSLLLKIVNRFYECLSNKEKERYHDDLSRIIHSINPNATLEDPYTFLSKEEKEQIKQHHIDLLTKVKQRIEEDPTYQHIFFTEGKGVGRMHTLDKSNIDSAIQQVEEEYHIKLELEA